MTDLPMTYAEYEPAAAVGALIAGYWTFAIAADAEDNSPLGAPPDGCMALTWRLGRGQMYVTGAHTEWRRILARPGDSMFGIRFWPGAAPALLPLDPPSLRGRVVPAGEFAGLDAFRPMTRALDRCRSDREAVAVADHHLGLLLRDAATPDAVALRTMARIVASAGGHGVADLARKEHLSPRQLRRRFLAAAGLSPQAFARTWRWRCAAAEVRDDGATDWTALAAQYGFADQPHLVREFRHAIGLTPKNYARLIARVDWTQVNLTRRKPPT